MSKFSINCGDFSSLHNFYNSVGICINSKFKEFTNAQSIELDCRLLNRNRNIKISVLTTALSFAHYLTNNLNKKCEILIGNDKSVLEFLIDSNFYYTTLNDQIVEWGQPNHSYENKILLRKKIKCKLFSLNNIFINLKPKVNTNDFKDILAIKNQLLEFLPSKLLAEFFSILIETHSYERKIIIDDILKIITEYAVNALVHGKSNCYIGMQASRNGISVCISDSGIGILNSLKNNYNKEWTTKINLNSDIDSILNASLRQNIEIGMRDTINKIIDHNGYTVISSGNAELIWGEDSWRAANSEYDHENYKTKLQTYENILKGFELKDQFSRIDLVESGGFTIFKYSLAGTRIFFELPYKTFS